MKRYAVELGECAGILMVADDEFQIAVKLARLVTLQQVRQAVQVLRDEERNILRHASKLDAPVHMERLCHRREGSPEAGLIKAGGRGGELDPHEKEAKFGILVLVRVQDVHVVALHQKVDDRRDQPLAVGAVDQ